MFLEHAWQLEEWRKSRERQALQHPHDQVRSRGEHYRRKNTGVAYRTYLHIFRPLRGFQGIAP